MTKITPEGFIYSTRGRLRVEPYTIAERPPDPPGMQPEEAPREKARPPMPPGYTPTIPVGGPPKPPPTSVPRVTLPEPDPRYRGFLPPGDDPWNPFFLAVCGIAAVYVVAVVATVVLR